MQFSPTTSGVKISRDGSLGIGTELQAYTVGLRFPVGAIHFAVSSPRRQDRLCGSPSLLSNGYRGLFPRQ
jgi:hypothetical protein